MNCLVDPLMDHMISQRGDTSQLCPRTYFFDSAEAEIDTNPLELVLGRMTLRTSSALMQTIHDLVSSGGLQRGDRLPTVREVAEASGMSRSAVGEAWRELGERGLIETRRRGGTRVLGKPQEPRALRYESMIRSTVRGVRDLANLRTDTLPYPALSRAMAWSVSQPELHAVFEPPITEELLRATLPDLPFAPQGALAMHGMMDSVELVLSLLVQPGDAVVVESPTLGRVLDILDSRGARVISIDYRHDGPDLTALQRALISKPVAFIYQPVGQAPSGRSVTNEWVAAVAAILPPTLAVVELSQRCLLGDNNASLGSICPDQVTHIRSYNMFFGADMRIAIVFSNNEIIEAAWMRLTYSTRFVSRILQGALAFLLTDAEAKVELTLFLAEMSSRHTLLTEALQGHGFDIENTLGPSLWIPVPDDHSVCTRLSLHGVAVHPGRFFLSSDSREQRIHLNSAAVDGDHESIAELVANACRFTP